MDKLGMRELLRYGYAGSLCVFVAALADRHWTVKLCEQLGPVLAPFVALAVGAVVYLVFKSLIGDRFLWWWVHRLHVKIDENPQYFLQGLVKRLQKRKWCPRWLENCLDDRIRQLSPRCKVHYLENTCKVPKGLGHDAYAFLRDQILEEYPRERFHLQHSEGYLLYLTALVCLVGSAFALRKLQFCVLFFGLFATVLFAFSAVLYDIVVCRAEYAAIRRFAKDKLPRDKTGEDKTGEDRIQELLRNGGFAIESKASEPGAKND
ncbi:MAG: hypothetical protein ABIP48_17340 [Planctomycetota bacterium]